MSGIKEIEGSNVLVTGRKLVGLGGQDISDGAVEEFISDLKSRNVKKVFMIFLGIDLERGYSARKQYVESRLAKEGITFIPLPKEPANIGPFETFFRNVRTMPFNEKALVMCYHGLHNSWAYASYHLLRSGWTFDRIYSQLKKNGLSDGSIGTIKATLSAAGVNVHKISQRNEVRAKLREKNDGVKKEKPNTHKPDPRLSKLKDFLHNFGRRH